MRFSRIVLENWRNFGSVDVTLQNRAFLVGPNASGKSNFLDAFRFLRDLVIPGGGFEQAVINRGGLYHVRHMLSNLPPVPDVVIQIELVQDEHIDWRYRIAFTAENQPRPILTEEKVWKANKQVLDRPNKKDQSDPEQLRQTYLEQTLANREFRELVDFFESVHYFHLVPHLVRDPERAIGQSDDPYGSDFLQQIADLDPTEQQNRLTLISNVLKLAVPQLRGLKLEKDKRGTAHLLGQYDHLPNASVSIRSWFNEADFSDGTLRLIGLLWSLLDGTGPLLLEEPELSLHPSVVRHIPQMMLSIQRERPYRQTILSTHSSDLLSDEGIAADEILLFIPAEGGTEVKVGADIEQVKHLLDVGIPPGEVVIPYTEPPNVNQMSALGD